MGARNPKEARFSVSLAGDINERLEALADAAGANKSVMGAMCLALGLNQMELLFRIGVQTYVDDGMKTAATDALSRIAADVHAVSRSGD